MANKQKYEQTGVSDLGKLQKSDFDGYVFAREKKQARGMWPMCLYSEKWGQGTFAQTALLDTLLFDSLHSLGAHQGAHATTRFLEGF